ncbi:MAG: DUF2274 domain-containing protein [Thiobacillus sp.]|nr:DUF2274 domain-containing protein [Thiobacillus sp.]
MPDLKLAKLPDRTPVKVTITVSPELHKALIAYQHAYRDAYNESDVEPLTELVPYMLKSFLDSDRGFAKARKKNRSATPDHAKVTLLGRGARGTSSAGS